MSKDRMSLRLKNRPFSPFIALLTRAGFLLLMLVGASGLSSTAYAKAAGATGDHYAAPANTAVLTNKYDMYRTGQNLNETILNTGNVNVNKFGKKLSYPVDGQVYAQPLYAPNVNVNGGTHNMAIVHRARQRLCIRCRPEFTVVARQLYQPSSDHPDPQQ